MKHAATQALYAYWNTLRGERASPERGEIDPAAIRGILADTFILEVDAARRFPFRISGTRLNALFAAELKGRSFARVWARQDRLDIVEILGAVCDDAVAVVAGVTAAPAGRDPIELELLLLPVRHMGKTHARIIGSLSPAVLPSWIGLLPLQHLSLLGLRVLSAPPARYGDCALQPPAACEADVQHQWNRPGHARRGHLFVHEGGR